MKKYLNLLYILLIVLCLCACESNKDQIEIKPILMESKNEVEIGNSIFLANNTNNSDVVYTTDNTDIVSIEGIKLTGLKVGVANITCTIGSKQMTFVVNVINPVIKITVTGDNLLQVDSQIQLLGTLSKAVPKGYESETIKWSSEDEKVAIVDDDGAVIGVGVGKTNIVAKIFDNITKYEIQVVEKGKPYISLSFADTMKINGSITPYVILYGTTETEYVLSSDNELVAKIVDGTIIGVGSGTCTIRIELKNDETVYFEKEITVEDTLLRLTLEGDKTMMQGKYNYLNVKLEGDDSDILSTDVTWESSDKRLALVKDGVVLAVNKGKVTITATSKDNPELKATFPIDITKYESEEQYCVGDLQKVDNIMANMTLEQKVGQMFFIGFDGTKYSTVLDTAINNCYFGNIIYMGRNVTDPTTLGALSNAIQNKMVATNGVPAFISTDQEGGRVARLQTKATHFISAMAVAATNNLDDAYDLGKGMGFELKNYGINMDLAPVLDVNNNPENPIIGNRSFSDDPMTVAMFGNKVYMGLEESGVVGCVKHFPGHGNTNVDSHTGLPVITSTKDELYQTELAPFISSISNGVGAIMTTHIIFTAIDPDYPATLSNKVLTGLLREELGYTGLIVTDGMGMAGVNQNYGTVAEIAVRGVKAGVDIFCYTGNDTPQQAHAGIVAAVKSGDISIDRINESVKRILLAKIKYGVMDDYLVENKNIDEELALNAALNYKMGEEAVTMVKGDFKINKTDKVLFISVESGYVIDGVTEDTKIKSNSLACYCATYLKSKGFENCDYYTTSNPITSSQSTQLLEKIKDYDKVVVGFSNVKTTNETPSINFMNAVADAKKENLLAVALNTPYDLLAYNNNVVNYCCIYCNQNATIVGFAKVMAGEIEAKGVSPVSMELFK